MMMKYMSPTEVLRQIDEIESNSPTWVGKHGQEFDISGLTRAYDNYISNYANWSVEQRKEAWCKGVGGQQRLLPAHIVSEYCRADRNMDNPNFRDEKELPRQGVGGEHEKDIVFYWNNHTFF